MFALNCPYANKIQIKTGNGIPTVNLKYFNDNVDNLNASNIENAFTL